jgi:N-acetylmuramoyl-L-alanine amidase
MKKPRILLVSGHGGGDPGAVANGYREADLTAEFTALVASRIRDRLTECACLDGSVKDDPDNLRLNDVIAWAKKHVGYQILLDVHFDAATPTATGTSVFIKTNASIIEQAFAQDLSKLVAETLKIPLRFSGKGVGYETDTRHKRLGILHTGTPISALLEICFITNASDMLAYQTKKYELADKVANLVFSYAQ